ncbi:hypothetical protein G6F36_009854 [Rhizopus arrhizus]|nr:hypothetical protein G6F36_009854 [Rhizopus arrhizus]
MPTSEEDSEEIRPLLELTLTYRRSVYWYASMAAVGGFVCGYDTGSISSIIALPIFQKLFFLDKTLAYYENKIGRRNSIFFSSFLLTIGIMLELAGINSRVLLSGRLVAGLGTGLMTNAIPLYQSEISPPDIRGRLVSLYSLFASFGQMVGYFITFRSSYIKSNWSWRLPWLVQLIVSILFLFSVFFLPYSPRWLISQGRESEGLMVLAKVHGLSKNHWLVQKEYKEIRLQTEADRKNANEQNYAQLFKVPNLERTLLAFFISIATCFTGNVVISYYAPHIFKNAGLDDVSISLALTGGIGLLSLIANMISLKWWVDMWGRRVLFLTGSAISAICMITVGFTFYFYANWIDDEMVLSNARARYVIIFCIYLFSGSFAATWAVGTYVYTAEIFSLKCRAKGLSLTYAISWAGSIVITYFTPFFLAYSISGWCILFLRQKAKL